MLQAHAISRAAYSMAVMPRRLLHLVMAQVQITDGAFETLEMRVGDILRALDLADDGRRYEEVRAAAKALMGEVLDIDTPEGWVMFHWVDKARYIKARDVIQFRLSEDLRPLVLEVKDMWRIIPIRAMSRLQGRHSYRIFEIVMADRGFAGKGGNRAGEWYTDLDFEHLRVLFKIGAGEYPQKSDFRRWVVEKPVAEINLAAVGLSIECDYKPFKRGKGWTGVRLKCKLIGPSDPRPVAPATQSESEEDSLIARYPDKYAELLAFAQCEQPLPGMSLLSPENRAMAKLAEWARGQAPAKRGRKPKPAGA